MKEPQNLLAQKYDEGRPRYDLLPACALAELVAVYTMGAAKYADRDWEKGMSWCRIFAAIMRHSWAWMSGQTHDPESRLHHMAHAAWGCLALIQYANTLRGEDDRPISPTTEGELKEN